MLGCWPHLGARNARQKIKLNELYPNLLSSNNFRRIHIESSVLVKGVYRFFPRGPATPAGAHEELLSFIEQVGPSASSRITPDGGVATIPSRRSRPSRKRPNAFSQSSISSSRNRRASMPAGMHAPRIEERSPQYSPPEVTHTQFVATFTQDNDDRCKDTRRNENENLKAQSQ